MKQKIKIISIFLAVVTAIAICFTVYNYAIIPGLNPKADKEKKSIDNIEKMKDTIPGDIYDSNGDVICYAELPGQGSICAYSAYDHLIGVDSPMIFGTTGLKARYMSELWKTDKNGKGQSMKLTTINEVQCMAYEVTKGEDGCVVVLENKTGKVIALTSTSADAEMDVNAFLESGEENEKQWKKLNKTEGFFVPDWLEALAPGSVIKAVTALVVVEKNWQNDIYVDVGNEHGIGNYGGYTYGKTDLQRALTKSVNTYFAHYGMKMGAYNLKNVFERFYIGKMLETDFGTIVSEHNLDKTNDNEIRSSAFGQGELLVTPINMAMVCQALANNGELYKPYVVEEIGGKQYSKTESLGKISDKDSIEKLDEMLKNVAINYGVDPSLKIRAKTGTAELPNGLNRASLVSYNDDYTVVISVSNTKALGRSQLEKALRIYDLLGSLK